jgi:3-phosphoshikimate 1-carboxyvinyltransferase
VIQWLDSNVRVNPVGPLRGSVRPPGSKSLTNRALVCACLADGRSELRRASFSDDAWSMIRGLQALGVKVEARERDAVLSLHGARGTVPADEADINVGNAGAPMRFLTALACLGFGRYRLDGSPRMRERPIGGLVDALRTIGAGVDYEQHEGYPPIVVLAHGLAGGEVVFDGLPSSQFLSALLMVAPYAARDVMIRVEGHVPSQPYVDMTIDVMRHFGIELLAEEPGRFIIPASQRYLATTLDIEPDASAAAYFWAAAAITGGAVRVEGLTRESRQGDVRFADVLAQMGCTVEADEAGVTLIGPQTGRLTGVDVDLNDMPDAVQTLAVVALLADGPTTIRNVANLRIKETDRIAALAAELAKLGARVNARADGLTIVPPATIRCAQINTYDDHRMAMSFALAGLAVEGIVIRNAACVSKSFPDYFDALSALMQGGRG